MRTLTTSSLNSPWQYALTRSTSCKHKQRCALHMVSQSYGGTVGSGPGRVQTVAVRPDQVN